jgi:MFS family permease
MKLISENLQRDVLVLMASRGVRAFAFSYLSIIFAIYLDQLGFSTVTVGLVFSTGYATSALLTAVWGYLADRYGRKNILILLAVLTIISNLLYLFFSHLIFILIAESIAAVGVGSSGAGGQGGGPFNPVEQALLAEKCTPQNRNRIFATNACVGSIMGSLGALVSGLPQYLQQRGWETVASYKPLFAMTVLFSIAIIFAYASIDEHHVPRQRASAEKHAASRGRRFGIVTKLAMLGVIDNLGAGLVSPLMSYWFFLRFGMELKSLGFTFFLSYILAACSFLIAPTIARRFGVVKTMAVSHGMASVLNILLPFSPTFSVAASITILRSFLAYMDSPLRSSFIMGVVKPEDRGSAAGITTLSRQVPVAVSPTISAYLMHAFSLNVPIFLGGWLQLINDFSFYFLFRDVKPPEEQVAATRPAAVSS